MDSYNRVRLGCLFAAPGVPKLSPIQLLSLLNFCAQMRLVLETCYGPKRAVLDKLFIYINSFLSFPGRGANPESKYFLFILSSFSSALEHFATAPPVGIIHLSEKCAYNKINLHNLCLTSDSTSLSLSTGLNRFSIASSSASLNYSAVTIFFFQA